MTKRARQPIFPKIKTQTITPSGSFVYSYEESLTKREFFIAEAIKGLLANPGGPIQANGMSGWDFCNCTPAHVVDVAFGIADAILDRFETENNDKT
jgi:hypothetical protein